jgi:hypothetical protein
MGYEARLRGSNPEPPMLTTASKRSVTFNRSSAETNARTKTRRLLWIPLTIALALLSFSAVAADYPAPKEADWTARDFKFHTGEVLPELRLHYTTIGEPSRVRHNPRWGAVTRLQRTRHRGRMRPPSIAALELGS